MKYRQYAIFPLDSGPIAGGGYMEPMTSEIERRCDAYVMHVNMEIAPLFPDIRVSAVNRTNNVIDGLTDAPAVFGFLRDDAMELAKNLTHLGNRARRYDELSGNQYEAEVEIWWDTGHEILFAHAVSALQRAASDYGGIYVEYPFDEDEDMRFTGMYQATVFFRSPMNHSPESE